LFLCDRLARRPIGDPERTFVIYMGIYAADVLRGELPGTYADHDARRFAQAALVPEELADPDRLAHVGRNLERTARALQLPVAELVDALGHIAAAAVPQRCGSCGCRVPRPRRYAQPASSSATLGSR
jgi:hypothetical protein